jgi:hypothetical protein
MGAEATIVGMLVIALLAFADFSPVRARGTRDSGSDGADTAACSGRSLPLRAQPRLYRGGAMLVGEALLFGNLDVLEYAFVVAGGFHLFARREDSRNLADLRPRRLSGSACEGKSARTRADFPQFSEMSDRRETVWRSEKDSN